MPKRQPFTSFLSFSGGNFIPWLDFWKKNFAAQTLQKHRCFWILGGDPPKKAAPCFWKPVLRVSTYKLKCRKSGILHSFQRHLQLWAQDTQNTQNAKIHELSKIPQMPQNSARKSTFYIIFIIQRRKLHPVTWFLKGNPCRSNIAKHRCFWILGSDPAKSGP